MNIAREACRATLLRPERAYYVLWCTPRATRLDGGGIGMVLRPSMNSSRQLIHMNKTFDAWSEKFRWGIKVPRLQDDYFGRGLPNTIVQRWLQ